MTYIHKQRFSLVLIKPSHYDDEGYVIQWFRSAIPSNSLAVLYGLAVECADQKVLGDDVELEIHAFDETNTRIRIFTTVTTVIVIRMRLTSDQKVAGSTLLGVPAISTALANDKT